MWCQTSVSPLWTFVAFIHSLLFFLSTWSVIWQLLDIHTFYTVFQLLTYYNIANKSFTCILKIQIMGKQHLMIPLHAAINQALWHSLYYYNPSVPLVSKWTFKSDLNNFDLTWPDYQFVASFPGPRPASHRLQYGKAGEGLVHFLT